MKKYVSIILSLVVAFLLTIPGAAAGAPPGGVLGGSTYIEVDLFTEALFTADDVSWIIEQAREIGESEYGFEWSDWKDPKNDYYLGGYNTAIHTMGYTKEQVLEGICAYYFEEYNRLGDVYSIYIELKPYDEVVPGGSDDYGPGHYWLYVYRG